MVIDNESEVMSECDKLFNYSACSYVKSALHILIVYPGYTTAAS